MRAWLIFGVRVAKPGTAALRGVSLRGGPSASAAGRLALVAGRLAGERDPERGSRFLAGRLESELAAHLPQQLSRDVQAQARAVAAGLCSTPGEAGENSLSVCRRNPRAVVGDGEVESAGGLVRRYLDLDLAFAAAVLQGVVQERPQDLVQLVRIPHGQPSAGQVSQLKVHRGGVECLPGATNSQPQRDNLHLGTQHAGLEPGDGEKLANEAGEPVRLLGHDLKAAVLGRLDRR